MKDEDKGTHGTPGPSTDVESVTADDAGAAKNVGKSVQGKGKAEEKDENESGRPKDGSMPKDTTGVDPQGPIDPKSPFLIPN